MHFFFPHRIARVSYFVRNVVVGVFGAIVGSFFETGRGSTAAVAVLLLAVYWGAFVVAPRCRDTGMSPWSAFLLLVPGVNIFLGGYLTWKRSWPVADGLSFSSGAAPIEPLPHTATPRDSSRTSQSDALRRLEALRDEGVLTEQDFLRRKARLGKND